MARVFLNASVSEADLQDIYTNIAEIEQKLLFLISLKTGEKRRWLQRGSAELSFTKKTYNYAKSNSSNLPPTINMDDYLADIELCEKMRLIYERLQVLTGKVQTTGYVAGKEALQTSTVIYNLFNALTEDMMPGVGAIKADLKTFFPRTGRKKKRQTF